MGRQNGLLVRRRWQPPARRRSHRNTNVDSRAVRRAPAADGYFAATRISGGRVGRKNGGPSLRPNPRARKTRRLQQANSDGRSSDNLSTNDRAATLSRTDFFESLQHASAT